MVPSCINGTFAVLLAGMKEDKPKEGESPGISERATNCFCVLGLTACYT